MPLDLPARRFFFSVLLFVILFFLVFYQLIQLTFVRDATLNTIAAAQHYLHVEIPPLRGAILDRQGKELAVSLRVPSIYGVPRLIGRQRKRSLAHEVSGILGLDEEWVFERLLRDKAFVWLKRKVSFEQAQKISALKDAGLGVLDEYRRFYPQSEFMANLLGFVDMDNRGLEGIELKMDPSLRGRAGLRDTKRDALGREIKAFEIKSVPALDGNRVYLTLDQYLQYLTERSLDQAYTRWKAEGAAAVLMEAKTGKILAMASRPTFDPNRYESSPTENRRNRAITDMYEPGSIFKIITASAALNEGLVTPETTFFCENGEYHYGTRVLHDVHPYGQLKFSEVLIKSSNIGIVKIAAVLEPETLHRYIQNFGFGKKTGIDLAGEATGFTNPPSRWSKTSPYNIPMGHEIMVTLIQMATAMAVIANGGDLVTPYVLDRIEDHTGVVLRENQPIIKRRVIEPAVSQTMREILVRAVEEGTGKSARISNVPVGGKTGTAQKVLLNGRGYSHSDFMSSFVGFGPADDNPLVMAVVVDDPGPSYYGGTVAAPVFKEVMEAAVIANGYVPVNAEVFDPSAHLEELPENPPMLLPA